MIRVTQSFFFPGLKVKPRPEWAREFPPGTQVQEVTATRKGKFLSGILLEPHGTDAAQKTVILAHPLSKRAKFFFSRHPAASIYLAAGYRVLAFDFNGFGNSERIDFFYWQDSKAWIEWVKNKFPGQEIILHGLSFGSFHIIRSTQALPSGSRVVLENTSRSLYDYWKRWWHTGLAVKGLQALPLKAFRDMNVLDYIKSTPLASIHFSLISCQNDKLTPSSEMEDLAQAIKETGAPVRVSHFLGATHLNAAVSGPDQYRSFVLNLKKQEESAV